VTVSIYSAGAASHYNQNGGRPNLEKLAVKVYPWLSQYGGEKDEKIRNMRRIWRVGGVATAGLALKATEVRRRR
jgi:hypothetical protein